MASTPSASALSAVLRCRGNIWARNPPTKRPATSAYSLGLSGGAQRDSLTERTGSQQAAPWETSPRGGRVVVGRRLTVSYRWDGADRELSQSCFPKPLQSPRSARSAAPCVHSPLVCQPARTLTCSLSTGQTTRSKITYVTKTARIYKIVFVREVRENRPDVLKLSLTSACRGEHPGQTPSFWWTLGNTCLSLTALVSRMILWKLLLCRSSSSSEETPQHLLRQQEEENLRSGSLQANGQNHSSSEDNKITQDGPD